MKTRRRNYFSHVCICVGIHCLLMKLVIIIVWNKNVCSCVNQWVTRLQSMSVNLLITVCRKNYLS